jgi:hypothetical protein
LGLELPIRPGGDSPYLDREIADLSDRRLMRLFAEVTAWANYAQGQAVIADAEEERLEALLKRRKTMGMLGEWDINPKMTVTQARARAQEDASLYDLEEEFLAARALHKLTEMVFKRFDRDASLLSRELTRRTEMANKEGRAGRWLA